MSYKINKPKVSICIPAYNQPDLLRRALQSILIQSFKNYEVIITDDSSDNQVTRVVKNFQFTKKIRYFKNQKRKGPPENWNESIRRASGEYIKILHHDDWFADKDSLANFVKMLDENPNVDFAFCSALVFDETQNYRFTHMPTEKQITRLKHDYNYLFLGNIIGPPSSTIYRNNVKKQFDSRLKWVVDIDFYISLLKENSNFIFNPASLICVTAGARHQVTRKCVNNKNIEIFEWLYLYNKIDKKYDYSKIRFIWRLLNKYNIKSINEVIESGMKYKEIHTLIRVLLWIKSRIL